jgi:hypothetical protein
MTLTLLACLTLSVYLAGLVAALRILRKGGR